VTSPATPGKYEILSVREYHWECCSSAGACAGVGMGCRSLTRGFRSIISSWSWRKLRTIFRVTPAGRGEMVVKTLRFAMVDVWLMSCKCRIRQFFVLLTTHSGLNMQGSSSHSKDQTDPKKLHFNPGKPRLYIQTYYSCPRAKSDGSSGGRQPGG
jgi:hypothetical protein